MAFPKVEAKGDKKKDGKRGLKTRGSERKNSQPKMGEKKKKRDSEFDSDTFPFTLKSSGERAHRGKHVLYFVPAAHRYEQ